jgi:hypothetical protein
MRSLFPILLLILFARPEVTQALVFDDGAVNDYFGQSLVGNNFVRDDLLGNPTTLNMRAGSELGASTTIEGGSALGVFPGSTLFRVEAEGASTVEVLGGTITGGLDLRNATVGAIASGDVSNASGPALRLFDDARATVSGGTFSASTVIVAFAGGQSALRIEGASFGGGQLRAEGDATLDVTGGTAFARIVCIDQALVTLYGDDFEASEGGGTVLAGYGELVDAFNGTLTGTLADGSPLAIDAQNGIAGSRIVLAPSPAVVPALGPIPVVALLPALLAGVGWLAIVRRV